MALNPINPTRTLKSIRVKLLCSMSLKVKLTGHAAYQRKLQNAKLLQLIRVNFQDLMIIERRTRSLVY